jgi:MFS transporter, PAT family, beta-lactamase induction signal transducer AmpG
MWMPAKRNPPWLFGLLAMPGGIAAWGLTALLIPYLLRKHGVPVDRIAEVVAIASVPNVWTFLAAPIVDLGRSRRFWLLLCAGLTALLGAAAILLSTGQLTWLTVALFVGTVTQGLASSSNGGLMTSVAEDERGRAGGFMQAGNIGAGAVSGGLMIGLAERVSLPWLAVLTALFIALPAVAAFWIDESPHPKLDLGPAFSALRIDVKDILSSRRTWLGLTFFLSPVGAGGLGNLISSVGPDYHASSDVVAWVTGAGGGLLMAFGALLGGWLCDRIPRMTAYAAFGILGALAALGLYLGPANAFTYAAGYGAYSITTGLAYAAFAAMILEVLGSRPRGAATGWALLGSAGNVPLSYMTWLDGIGYGKGGVGGLMLTEAVLGGLGGLALLLLARRARFK